MIRRPEDLAGGGLGDDIVVGLLAAGDPAIADEAAVTGRECGNAADDPLAGQRPLLAELENAVTERCANAERALDAIVDALVDIGGGDRAPNEHAPGGALDPVDLAARAAFPAEQRRRRGRRCQPR